MGSRRSCKIKMMSFSLHRWSAKCVIWIRFYALFQQGFIPLNIQKGFLRVQTVSEKTAVLFSIICVSLDEHDSLKSGALKSVKFFVYLNKHVLLVFKCFWFLMLIGCFSNTHNMKKYKPSLKNTTRMSYSCFHYIKYSLKWLLRSYSCMRVDCQAQISHDYQLSALSYFVLSPRADFMLITSSLHFGLTSFTPPTGPPTIQIMCHQGSWWNV